MFSYLFVFTNLLPAILTLTLGFYNSGINAALNCNISQIHIAQGLTPESMTISWVTLDN